MLTPEKLAAVMSADVFVPLTTLSANTASTYRIAVRNKDVRRVLRALIQRGMVEVTAGVMGSPAKYKLRRQV